MICAEKLNVIEILHLIQAFHLNWLLYFSSLILMLVFLYGKK